MIEVGREELTRELRRADVPLQRVWKSDALALEVEAAGYSDLDSLLAAVGEYHVSAQSLAQKVARSYHQSDDDAGDRWLWPRLFLLHFRPYLHG
ncbi:MAG: hypothetical protein ACKO9A_26425 [Alphaproteobacteria bacterium]